MNKYLLVSLAMTPAAVSPVPATQPTFIVDGMHAYNFDKLGDDLIEGIKRKQIFITTPNDTRIDNFTHFFKDSANASDVNVVEILSTFERMLQKNPTVDLSEKIKVIASNLTFTNFVFDKDTNEGIIRNTLVPKILADLKIVEGQITDLKAAELVKVETLLTAEAEKYNLKYKTDTTTTETPSLTAIHNEIVAKYYEVLNGLPKKAQDRPFIDAPALSAKMVTEVKALLNSPSSKRLIEAEMLKKFEKEVKALTVVNSFTTKDLRNLESSQSLDNFEVYFHGVKALLTTYTRKQRSFNVVPSVAWSDYDEDQHRTKFHYSLSVGSGGSSLEMFKYVATQIFPNKATQVVAAIRGVVEPLDNIHAKESEVNALKSDAKFAHFLFLFHKVDTAIKTVNEYAGVTIESKFTIDTEVGDDAKGTIMIGELTLKDTVQYNKQGATAIDKEFAIAKYTFRFKVDRIIDVDFKEVKKAIEARTPDTVYSGEVRKPHFNRGTHWSQHEVEEFLGHVSSGDNIKEVMDKFPTGKHYSLTATVSHNAKDATDPGNRVIHINYLFKETSGAKHWISKQVTYIIADRPIDSIIQRLKDLHISHPSPVVPSNIDSYLNRDWTKTDIEKLIPGFSDVFDAAAAKGFEITWTQFRKTAGGTLKTTFTVTQKTDNSVTEAIDKELSHHYLTQAEKDKAKLKNIQIEKKAELSIDKIKLIKNKGEIKAKISAIIQKANKDIDDKAHLNEKELETIVEKMVEDIKKLIKASLGENLNKLIAAAKAIHGDPLPQEIMDKLLRNQDELLAELNNMKPGDFDPNTLLKLLEKTNLKDLLAKAKTLTNVSKYALTGIGGVLGLGGLFALFTTFKIWTTNKKMKEIPGSDIKLKSAKKMGLLSTVIGLLSIGGSIALMLFVFIAKGGF